MSFAKLAAAVLAAFALPAAAQAPARPDLTDPDAVLVEELVVVARDKGPAWWRVSDADTTVYVLGAPSVLPKSQPWDHAVLERRLEGAHTVVLPFNSVSVNVLNVPGLLVRWATLKSGPLEDRLPAPLKARFAKAREAVGQPAKRYGYKNELLVGILLVGDYRDHARLTSADPAKTVERLAKARKIKVETRSMPLGAVVGDAVRLPPAVQRACLEDALAEVEAGPGAAQRAGALWAEGDVREALGLERSYEKCVASLPGALNLDARFKAEQAAAIERALAKPGHAVAVVQLRPLLSQGGVLDRLRAKGYEIGTPDGE
ncbi:MAG: TraB/GumN family protein [Phenylobacterium sp.]|uniref:TraB/GumN family protein n=1 Tax=Phenylobacterium sp. TaxID=1871053 RepID=UPI00391965F5